MLSSKKHVIECASGALLSNANTYLAILTRSVCVIRTTGFSHPHRCVPRTVARKSSIRGLYVCAGEA